jgi:riboflavin synthase
MFTGIIECIGTVVEIRKDNRNLIVQIQSPISTELKIDQSLAHNGICLTVTKIENNTHTICAVPETIEKTTIGTWQLHDKINLERCMLLNARVDGHLVQGHVDDAAVCTSRIDHENNWLFTFQINEKNATLIIEKGSVCINGISLTCFNVTTNTFDVTIIPYTFEHTNMHQIKVGSSVNIEFDVIGKYLNRLQELQK